MNKVTDLQHKKRQPRAWSSVLMRGVAPRVVTAAAVGLLMGLPAPVAYAYGGDASQIHSCVKKNDVRTVGPSQSCKSNEPAVEWSTSSDTSNTDWNRMQTMTDENIEHAGPSRDD